MSISIDKSSIRKEIKALRDNLDEPEIISKSGEIFSRLVLLPEYKTNNKIFTYISAKNEVDTIKLINYSLLKGRKVYVPKVTGKEMDFYEISDLSECVRGYMGIYEPDTSYKEPDLSGEGLFIMPGVAFDNKLNRIGFGGGFYDRYLERFPSFTKVAICYDFQLVESIPAENTDIKPDILITETKEFRR